MKGFSLIELLIVISIFGILAALTVASFHDFRLGADLEEETSKIIDILRLAQNKTISSVEDTSYGVHFETDHYVLFSEVPYSTSSPSNETFDLSKNVEISNISLAASESDVVFDRLTGRTENWGEISLRSASEPTKTETIYIASSGIISKASSSLPLGEKIADSRHVHFEYNRLIDTVNETLTLRFYDPPNPPTDQEIVIDNNINMSGQLYWQGTITVGEDDQVLEVKTHQLNNPATTFSIHRDRRYNDKAVSLFLSGDPGNSLIEYTANGTTTVGSSVFVSELQWQ